MVLKLFRDLMSIAFEMFNEKNKLTITDRDSQLLSVIQKFSGKKMRHQNDYTYIMVLLIIGRLEALPDREPVPNFG